MTVERNLAGIERDQPDHHIKGGGFAGAVRTQQSDNLAAFDFQGNILNDRACAKAFLQMTRRQRALAYRHRIRRRRAARAFFSDFPCVASAFSAFGIAAGSHPSRCARRNLLRPHRSPYCLRARPLGQSTEKCSSAGERAGAHTHRAAGSTATALKGRVCRLSLPHLQNHTSVLLHFFYRALWWIAAPCAVMRLLWRARRNKQYARHIGERFGDAPGRPLDDPAPLLWVHAVSVGETRAAQPLVEAWLAAHPHTRVLMTHMTPSGRAMGEALFGARALRCYLPYDMPFAIQRFLARYRPALG